LKKFVVLFVFFIPILTFAEERQPAGVELLKFYAINGPVFDLTSHDRYSSDEEGKQNFSLGAIPTLVFGINIFSPSGHRMKFDFGFTNIYFSYDISSEIEKSTNKYSFSYLFVGYRFIDSYVFLGTNFMVPISGSKSSGGEDFETLESGDEFTVIYSVYLGSDIRLWSSDKSDLNLKLQTELYIHSSSGFYKSYEAFNLPIRFFAGISYDL
jgi:hypothetical protein